jgi:hypothetical protein
MIHGDFGIAPEKAIFATAEDLRRNLRCALPTRIIDRSELRWRMKSIILRQDNWSDRLNRPTDPIHSEHYATNYYFIRYRISSFRDYPGMHGNLK